MVEQSAGGAAGSGHTEWYRALDTHVNVAEEPSLNLVSFETTEDPEKGETIEAIATVSGNYDGQYRLLVDGEEYRFELEAGEETEVAIVVTVPETYTHDFDVEINGEYLLGQ